MTNGCMAQCAKGFACLRNDRRGVLRAGVQQLASQLSCIMLMHLVLKIES